ncbi:DUF3135 domain-containing protein [Shewanella sp. 10N.261.52.F9]|uniref:DUF3135 domain-containing protein n=1 Tax=Shewanella TaxID=22 RepID=UPI00200D2D09|nr:DUF3135 domain-containing protein [Shewanella marinintestina]MCL1145715.1 DUF3135 domain-containing protein [Shewanella marinintestina]
MTELPSFDKLLWLAQNAPKKLDALQKKLSQEAIATSNKSNQANLNSLLNDLDKRLALCKSPYQRCQLVSCMMFQKLGVLNKIYSQPQHFLEQKADIVAFSKQQNKI